MSDKYRRLSAVIDAIQFDGSNYPECESFLEGHYDNTLKHPNVTTPSGTVRVDVGSWIIKGVAGEFYPCKPDIFEQTYERVEE